ncbi:MAG TPA: MerR family DNA-binding transcriptional regulator, partial [Rhizobiales bacterium]|nr:MerR family DNA-binding transcriptional regulator [Hyphomicrobiales bacterium]
MDAFTMSAAPDQKQKTRFTIRELVNEFGVTSRTLRFYEDKGLLSPERDGRSRIYKRRDRARLKLILQGKRVGFSLAQIKEMMDLYDLRDGQSTQLQFSLDRFYERIQALEAQKCEIEQAISDLKRTCTIVEGMLAQRPASAGGDSYGAGGGRWP